MASVEMAKKFIEVTGQDKILDSRMKQIPKELERMIDPNKKLTKNNVQGQEDIKRVMSGVEEVLNRHRTIMLEIIATGFVGVFSDEELDKLIKFYDCESGQSILDKQDAVADKNIKEIYQYMDKIIYPELENKFLKILSEIEKEVLEETAAESEFLEKTNPNKIH